MQKLWSRTVYDASRGQLVPTSAGGVSQILGSIARDLLMPNP